MRRYVVITKTKVIFFVLSAEKIDLVQSFLCVITKITGRFQQQQKMLTLKDGKTSQRILNQLFDVA